MAKKKTKSLTREEKLDHYENVIAALANVERKGAKMPYTSMNGHMFSFLAEDGTLALRLPEAERESFLKKHKTTLCERHGKIMKEYVVVPDALLKKQKDLLAVFKTSVSYIASLKPKPTTKKKKSTTPNRKKVARKTASKKK